jgi:hypothetical protein
VQLIVNAVRPSNPCPEVFHAKDDLLLRGLISYRDVVQQAKTSKDSGRS